MFTCRVVIIHEANCIIFNMRINDLFILEENIKFELSKVALARVTNTLFLSIRN